MDGTGWGQVICGSRLLRQNNWNTASTCRRRGRRKMWLVARILRMYGLRRDSGPWTSCRKSSQDEIVTRKLGGNQLGNELRRWDWRYISAETGLNSALYRCDVHQSELQFSFLRCEMMSAVQSGWALAKLARGWCSVARRSSRAFNTRKRSWDVVDREYKHHNVCWATIGVDGIESYRPELLISASSFTGRHISSNTA